MPDSPNPSPTAVAMFSSGAASWGASKRAAEHWGAENTVLLFADVLGEDDDNYRFLIEGAANVYNLPAPVHLLARCETIPPVARDMAPRRDYLAALAADAMEAIPGLKWIADGRGIWGVFRDERYLGNSRIDPCSKHLKRKLMRRWLEEECDPASAVVVLGYDWSEGSRIEEALGYDPTEVELDEIEPATEGRWKGWRVANPLSRKPYLWKPDLLSWIRDEGMEPPRIYEDGFAHANCAGACVKAGQAPWAALLRTNRDRFLHEESEEQEMREYLGGADVSILRDWKNGGKPLTLRAFRERLEAAPELFDHNDWGSCSCMSSPGADDEDLADAA